MEALACEPCQGSMQTAPLLGCVKVALSLDPWAANHAQGLLPRELWPGDLAQASYFKVGTLKAKPSWNKSVDGYAEAIDYKNISK